jgi:hypothetical protein
MGIEELGLGLASIGSLAVPPAGSAAIDDMALFAGDLDVRARKADKRTFPLLVSEGRLAPEDYLYTVVSHRVLGD